MLSTIKHDLKKIVCARVWVVLLVVVVLAVAVLYRAPIEKLVMANPYYVLGALVVVAAVYAFFVYRMDRCEDKCQSPNQEEQLECLKACEANEYHI